MIKDLVRLGRAKKIAEFPRYVVTVDGRIWSEYKQGWKIPTLNKGLNYQTVVLYPGNTRKYIHRLVLETFAGPCPSGMECCHIDGNRLNNHIYNLRWDTRSGNIKDAIKHGTFKTIPRFGSSNNLSKLTEEQVIEIRNRYKTWNKTQNELGKEYGITGAAVGYIVRRNSWTHV